jgi:hypothetical protein
MDDEQLNDWADSFDVTSEDAPAPEEKEVENEPAEPAKDAEEETPKEPDTKDEELDAPQGASDATEESSGDAEETGEPAAEDAKDTPVEEPKLTREDIKAALQEVEQEKTSYVDDIKQTSKDVLDSFYPQGIDRQLRDKDGDPIKSIEDVMERVDPRTGENFTEEAAGRWLLSEQQKLNQQIQELEASAERVAEVNVNLKRDAHRVVEKYSDILAAKPELATKIKALYEQSLRKDAKTGITLEAPIPLLEFYDTYLEPYVTGAVQQPTPPPVEPEKPKANPADRADLPTTNGSDNLSKEDREWAEIAKEYHTR